MTPEERRKAALLANLPAHLEARFKWPVTDHAARPDCLACRANLRLARLLRRWARWLESGVGHD